MLRLGELAVGARPRFAVFATKALPGFAAIAAGRQAAARAGQPGLLCGDPVARGPAAGAERLQAPQQIVRGLANLLHPARVGKGAQIGFDEYLAVACFGLACLEGALERRPVGDAFVQPRVVLMLRAQHEVVRGKVLLRCEGFERRPVRGA